MKRKLSGVFLALGCLCLVTALLTLACYNTATDSRKYADIHSHITTDTGLTDEGVKRADEVLAAYLRDVKSLEYEDEVYGATQKVFNSREIEHMKDVKALFGAARSIGLWTLAAGVVLCLLAAAMNAKDYFIRLCRDLIIADAGVVLCLGAGALFIANDFSGAFLGMHGLLFKNDLWLMNPETDLMIRLLPEEFFTEITKKIALSALGKAAWLAAPSAIALSLFKRAKK